MIDLSSRTTMEVSLAEALVLHLILSRFDDGAQLAIVDDSERQVIWDLTAQLEEKLDVPFSPEYKAILAKAKLEIKPGGDAGPSAAQ